MAEAHGNAYSSPYARQVAQFVRRIAMPDEKALQHPAAGTLSTTAANS